MALWTLITSTVFLRGQFSFTASAQGHDQVLWNQIPRGEEPNSLWFSQLARSDFLILLILVHVDMRMLCAMSVVWWKYTNDSWHSSLSFLTGKRCRDVEDIWRLEAFSTFLSNPFHLQTPPNPNLCRHSLVYSGFAMYPFGEIWIYRRRIMGLVDLHVLVMCSRCFLSVARAKKTWPLNAVSWTRPWRMLPKRPGEIGWFGPAKVEPDYAAFQRLHWSSQSKTSPVQTFSQYLGGCHLLFFSCFSVFFLNNLDKWEMFPIEAAILQHTMRKRSFYSLVNAFC